MNRAMAAEAGMEVLNASVFGGFPLADIPHVGLGAVVVGNGDAAAAGSLLDECELHGQPPGLEIVAGPRPRGFCPCIDPARAGRATRSDLNSS